MSKENINLTQAEWQVMEILWQGKEFTGREIVDALSKSEGWSRSTILTLLSRLENKGIVSSNTDGALKTFSAVLGREDAALFETESLLSKLYGGSLSLMVSTLAQRENLSRSEIDELYDVLRRLEEGNRDA